jgi:hypothetical protein
MFYSVDGKIGKGNGERKWHSPSVTVTCGKRVLLSLIPVSTSHLHHRITSIPKCRRNSSPVGSDASNAILDPSHYLPLPRRHSFVAVAWFLEHTCPAIYLLETVYWRSWTRRMLPSILLIDCFTLKQTQAPLLSLLQARRPVVDSLCLGSITPPYLLEMVHW